MATNEKIFGLFDTGQQVDEWQIERELRQGSQGGVLQAREITTGELVALKVPFISSPADAQRCERERKVLGNLTHPGVVALRGNGLYMGQLPFLVLEFVDGVRLDRFANERCMSINERCHLFLRVCKAVEYAHSQSVIHCDLNPSNVLVSGDGVIKVIDFGSAFSKGVPGHVSTGAEHRGTPHYMSPEQIRGQPLDERTDVYSLGVIFYQALCGSTPFALTSEATDAIFRFEPEVPSVAMFRQGRVLQDGEICHLDPQRVAQARSTTPEALATSLRKGLDEVALTALQVSIDRRYPTVAQLKTAVESVVR